MAINLYASFRESASHNAHRPALMIKRQGRYVAVTYGELVSKINTMATRLKLMGIKKSDAIGIISCNRPEWVITDLAALQIGAVIIPIYPTSSASTIRYIIHDSKMKVLVVESIALLDAVSAMLHELPDLKQCILIDPVPNDMQPESLTFVQMCEPLRETIEEEVEVSQEE